MIPDSYYMFLMATVVTYLLVSDPSDPDAVRSHPMLQEHGFEPQPMEDSAEDTLPALRFAVTSALEDSANLQEPCRELSADFPKATVTFCEVEERFDQVEHLRSVVFIEGKKAGEVEHGYILNIGA
ncbi:MAG: hypothetical protein ABEL51_12740 [Salinibacter sp.]